MGHADFAVTAPLPATSCAYDGRATQGVVRDVAVEAPVNIMYGPTPFAVMMTTPRDLIDFAYGFSLTEGVIARAEQIHRVEVRPQERGIELHIALAPGMSARALDRERNTVGRTGCGLCGIDKLDALPMTTPTPRARHDVHLDAVHRALEALERNQTLNALTHAVHAAAWCRADGSLVAVREDVGRHNALDKVLGALLRVDHAAADGFLVITSRCSFEMVEKAAAYGASTIVAISAPTSLAIERAVLHDMTLLAVARRDSVLVFHGADCVHADSTRPVTNHVTHHANGMVA